MSQAKLPGIGIHAGVQVVGDDMGENMCMLVVPNFGVPVLCVPIKLLNTCDTLARTLQRPWLMLVWSKRTHDHCGLPAPLQISQV